jgi:hypothetical protein
MISRAVMRRDLVNRARKLIRHELKPDPENSPEQMDIPDTHEATDIRIMNDSESVFLTVIPYHGCRRDDHDEIVSLIADLLNFAKDGL